MKSIKYLIFFILVSISFTASPDESFAASAAKSQTSIENTQWPRHRLVWIKGHYKINRHGRVVWVPGHWRRVRY